MNRLLRFCIKIHQAQVYVVFLLCFHLTVFILLHLSVSVNNFSEKAMAPHSSTLAWKTPWMEEPGRLQSMGSLRVGHD